MKVFKKSYGFQVLRLYYINFDSAAFLGFMTSWNTRLKYVKPFFGD